MTQDDSGCVDLDKGKEQEILSAMIKEVLCVLQVGIDPVPKSSRQVLTPHLLLLLNCTVLVSLLFL